MDETNFLDESDDKYADRRIELCDKCNLPRLVVSYELGFRLIQEQLIQLRADLQLMVNKIDVLEHK